MTGPKVDFFSYSLVPDTNTYEVENEFDGVVATCSQEHEAELVCRALNMLLIYSMSLASGGIECSES